MIYAVMYSYYSDWEIYGYFTNREDADKYCVAHKDQELYVLDNLGNFIVGSTSSMNYDEKITDVLSSLKPYLKFEHNENADLDRNEIENDYDMRFINNKIILDVEEILDINSIRRYKHAVINDDIILKGLPSEHGNGSFVNPVLKIAPDP